MSDSLRTALLEMEADDDRTRKRLAADGSLFEGYHPEMEAVHRRNAAQLRSIVAAHGWPGRSLVGNEAASAAWRILQHAIGEPDFMRECLPLLDEAAGRGDVDPSQLAMLVDRIRVLEGRPQLYGTQYDWSEEGAWMTPMGNVEEPATIDERRHSVGLPPIEWRREAPAGEPYPTDLAARREAMVAWAKRVGWR